VQDRHRNVVSSQVHEAFIAGAVLGVPQPGKLTLLGVRAIPGLALGIAAERAFSAAPVQNSTAAASYRRPIRNVSPCQCGVGMLYTTIDQAGSPTGTPASRTLSHTTITSYQKNGVVISGSGAVVTLNGNTVAGEGEVNYIAQNGIQVSFGASARLFDNNVSLNDYTPSKVTACGLLIYKAGGVSGEFKSGISYIKADNNFHNNETNICNFGKGGGTTPAS